jgi:hypothetical protein
MKFIALADTMDYKSGKMDIVHVLLFHGDSLRADAPPNPADWNSWGQSVSAHDIGDDLSHPLLLIRSGVYVPPIFNPYTALVVREDLYQRLRNFPGLVFVEAKPHKLINLWKPIGDFSFYKSKDPVIRRNKHRPDMLLDWMPSDPSLFATFPKCYELVAYNVSRYPGPEPHTVKAKFVMNNHRKTEVEFSCSSSIIDTYPLLWSSVFLLRQDLFDLVEDAIDYNFFAVKPVDL